MKNCETLERMLAMSADSGGKRARFIARSFYTVLRRNGFTHPEVMEVTGNILDEVMKDIRVNGKDRSGVPGEDHAGSRPPSKVVA